LSDAQKAQYTGENGTPYPATRERRNVGNFYPLLAQRTVGTGGCTGGAPHRTTAATGHALRGPARRHATRLREAAHRRERVARQGRRRRHPLHRWSGGIAVVYTAAANARGYALITIYDDVAE